MRTRQYTFRIGIVLLIMLDTLRRSFLHHDAFDRAMLVVELLVLFLIGVEIAYHVVRHYVVRHRISVLYRCLSEGELLLIDAPKSGTAEDIKPWCDKAENWEKETANTLGTYSVHAGIAFLHSDGSITPAREIISIARDDCRYLQQCINNLLGIIEKPDVYL
jgi:hypothetical protein